MSAMIETTWLGCPGTLTDTDGCVGLLGPLGLVGDDGPFAAGALRREDAEAAGGAADAVAAALVEAATGSVATAITRPAARRSRRRRGAFTGAGP
ncbi:MAG TPA: hypothetical protein VEV65_10795 [Kineosporiaceae bacterium]|nr:hypothetical protein [Kineosporiaceae bacterium]